MRSRKRDPSSFWWLGLTPLGPQSERLMFDWMNRYMTGCELVCRVDLAETGTAHRWGSAAKSTNQEVENYLLLCQRIDPIIPPVTPENRAP